VLNFRPHIPLNVSQSKSNHSFIPHESPHIKVNPTLTGALLDARERV
jgi:hypothetical protein